MRKFFPKKEKNFKSLHCDLILLRNFEKAEFLKRFFKTGKGEYAEGDNFLGIKVPEVRKIAKKYKDLSFSELKKGIISKYHEERLCILLILVLKFKNGNDLERKKVFDFYLKNIMYVNNWDLVDLTAPKIIGAYLYQKNRKNISLLKNMAKSKNLWKKRIAIISTFYFICQKSLKETMEITEILLYDKHDLIQKAVGWMLREIGKKVSFSGLCSFLDKYADTMPRTALRYSIEKFPEELRKNYLNARLQKHIF